MSDVLIYGDTYRSPELRHEVPLGVPDPFLYAEVGGVRQIAINSLELPRLAALGLYELHSGEALGSDELIAAGKTAAETRHEIAARAVAAFGLRRASVPETFPVWLADRLRADGVELVVDASLFAERRRVKSEAEVAGVRRAQRAAEAGMDVARDIFRRATPNGSGLAVDGKPLTVELVKTALARTFVEHGASCDDFIVAPAAQGAVGHDMGSGPIPAGVPIVIDVWPRDNETSCFADMTRTYVVGEIPADVARWHALVLRALERAVSEVGPGVSGRRVFDGTCEIFEAAGEPTQRTKTPGAILGDGFFHGLGHGVGLEVHEPPSLGIASHDELRAGDVVTVEPGLYRQGYGGVRLEDLVLVTGDGRENLTEYPYDLEP